MLDYAGAVDVSREAAPAEPQDGPRRRASATGAASWHAGDVDGFERVAGDLLAELGYELADRERPGGPGLGARMALACVPRAGSRLARRRARALQRRRSGAAGTRRSREQARSLSLPRPSKAISSPFSEK